MSNLCIIPARGGSKRIPRKNIKDFLGKPIISYSIEASIKSGLFEEVMVSTDDAEIADIAQMFGASVPFMRSSNNANDFATTVDVIREVIENYENQQKYFTNACCIYPTAPLIDVKKLIQGYEKLTIEKRDSIFPVVSFPYPVWRGFRVLKDGRINMVWPEFLNSRSQDLDEVYHDAGQWYWFNVGSLKSKLKIFSENSASIILSALEVQDIDNLSDWKIAEIKYEYLQSIK